LIWKLNNSKDLPVVLRLIEPAGDSMGRSAVHDIVKAVMRETADRLRKAVLESAGMAAHIERASTHWLRRTAGLHQSDGIDFKIVRDTLGHANIATNTSASIRRTMHDMTQRQLGSASAAVREYPTCRNKLH
jgi:site-specific recombinase XerD